MFLWLGLVVYVTHDGLIWVVLISFVISLGKKTSIWDAFFFLYYWGYMVSTQLITGEGQLHYDEGPAWCLHCSLLLCPPFLLFLPFSICQKTVSQTSILYLRRVCLLVISGNCYFRVSLGKARLLFYPVFRSSVCSAVCLLCAFSCNPIQATLFVTPIVSFSCSRSSFLWDPVSFSTCCHRWLLL